MLVPDPLGISGIPSKSPVLVPEFTAVCGIFSGLLVRAPEGNLGPGFASAPEPV